MARVIVLGGAGAICREATRALAQIADFEEVVLAEGNPAAAERLISEIGSPRLRAVPFEAEDESGLTTLLKGFDVAVNGLPYRYDVAVTRACVAAGVSGLDLSTTEEQFDFDEAARRKGLVFVPGCGATPGITNMLVQRAGEAMDFLEEVDIAFAAFRCLAPAPGLLTTTLWEFNPDEPARQRVFFEDGALRPAPPLTGGLEVDFGGEIGRQLAYLVPHPEATTLPGSYPSLRHAAVRGCFAPQVMRILSALLEAGVLSTEPVAFGKATVPALDAVHALLLSSPATRMNETWGYGLVVSARGQRGGAPAAYTARTRHPPMRSWGGEAAYFKNVGLPLAVGATMIARRQTLGSGVLPPERAFPHRPFLEALAEWGIVVEANGAA
jgi:saccharopine dehydrogenase-like NADP-dependent oxidoreductase